MERNGEEERELIEDFDSPTAKNVGQILLKFNPPNGEGKKKLILGTGILIDKLADDEWLMLTCAHNFEVYSDCEQLQLLDCKFFL